MGKRFLLLVAVAFAAMVIVPAIASASLVNEYGMNYAGQSKCLDATALLGPSKVGPAQPLRDARPQPGVPAGWTIIKAAGNAPQVPGTGDASVRRRRRVHRRQHLGHAGQLLASSATEYLFWKGSTDPNVMPWNLIEGLVAEPGGEWIDRRRGARQGPLRRHATAASAATSWAARRRSPRRTATATVPNPAATLKPHHRPRRRQWARDDSKTAADFMTRPHRVVPPVMSIQCETCHGTGAKVAGGHMGTGTTVNHRRSKSLGQSQVCGQCHGSYTTVAGTLGIYGYTPNLPLRNFVDVNGVSGGQSYTKIPTVDEFMAAPTAYWMFPNGSNAKGNHYYYDEWAASAHSYRGALHQGLPGRHGLPGRGQRSLLNAKHRSASTAATSATPVRATSRARTPRSPRTSSPTVDNVGFMGQECARATGPSVGVGAEDVVREPDKAGERSATGLDRGQRQHLRGLPQLAVRGPGHLAGLRAASRPRRSRGAPSHPQRETLHGSPMVEVAERRRVHARRQVRRLPHAQDQQGRQPHLPRHEAHAAG